MSTTTPELEQTNKKTHTT